MGPMLAFFSISPLGAGESVSGAVAKVIELIEQSGLEHRTNAMGTIIEGESKDVFDLLYHCHELMQKDYPRVTSKVLIDYRRGTSGRLESKLDSLEEKLGRKIER
jgi:uncharacterized protein (TIGR00106 family)